ncbi:hypothetical protein I5F65_08015 [Pseudomonas aeruginosa]|nr:hypothetical protein [Pseudomonas aeruginosa]
MNKQPIYEARHPVAIALAGLARAMRSGADILDGLAEQARSVGVAPWSPDFDDAARLLDYHYSRAWDAYVSREDLTLAERHPLAHAH